MIGDVMPRLRPGAAVVVISTRFHTDDLFGRLEATGKYKTIVLAAIASEHDEIGARSFPPQLSQQKDGRCWIDGLRPKDMLGAFLVMDERSTDAVSFMSRILKIYQWGKISKFSPILKKGKKINADDKLILMKAGLKPLRSMASTTGGAAVSAQLIADLVQGVRRSVVGLLLLALGLGPASGENLQQFPTELRARQHCDPSDIVVWLNTATGIYHLKGMRWYGNTKSGAFICQKDGDRAGYRLSVFCRYCSVKRD